MLEPDKAWHGFCDAAGIEYYVLPKDREVADGR